MYHISKKLESINKLVSYFQKIIEIINSVLSILKLNSDT